MLIIFLLVNRITKSVSTQKLFHTVVVYSKPPTEKRYLLFIKSRDQSNMRKNKSILIGF